MKESHPPLPVKLFVGMLSPEPELFKACAEILGSEYGPVEYESDLFSWNNTDYYCDEMGENILRKFLFFERVMDPGKLPSVKHFTIGLEKRFAIFERDSLRRRINIDPGYVTEAKVVLATTKDFAHRLYIGDNLYGEVTLRYSTKERSFIPHEFTYPDFRTDVYLALFNGVRESLRVALHGRTQH
ncbi:MAG TPA: DUF4416 family protein [Nitrospirota bacterium]|nr:DUF4416 family protein [Nitrospirota bacterium]